MLPIKPEMPPFIAPFVGKLITVAIYGCIGLVLGSVLGYTIRKLIYAADYHNHHMVKPVVVAAAVCLLLIITCGILIGVFDAGGYAIVYGIGALVGTVSFSRPWWAMRH